MTFWEKVVLQLPRNKALEIEIIWAVRVVSIAAWVAARAVVVLSEKK